MTSRIEQPPRGPINTQTPRRAEDTDTRQGIQRHDPEFHRKKKDDKEEGGFTDPYEDLTDVSVPALRNFLSGLLDRMGAVPSSVAASTQADSATHNEQRAPANPKAAAAMAAYQTGAVRGTSAQTHATPSYTRSLEPAPAQDEPPSALDQAAAGLQRSDVLELIRDLDRLQAQGVAAITLEKGEGFLASIRAGIARAMTTA